MTETAAATGGATCPQCAKAATELIKIDGDLRGRIMTELGTKKVADNVCPNCYNSFVSRLNKEDKKRSKRVAREQNRLSLWRSRVTLIREARDRFAAGELAKSAVAYEKYFRVLEIIYEVEPNGITVNFFNNSARAKELVVIASAYWDLFRIYDQSKRFNSRLTQVSDKLAAFLPFTPISGEITRRIEDYRKVAKNRDVVEQLLRKAKKGKGKCFIATATFESADAPEVMILRQFRDLHLVKSAPGRLFTNIYYRFSPPVADLLEQSPRLRRVSRLALRFITQALQRTFDLKSDPRQN